MNRPKEWKEGTLDDLCELKQDTCLPVESGSDFYVGLEHVESGRFSIRSNGKPEQVMSAKNRFEANNVLYGKLRPYLDKVVVADKIGICSTDILVLSPKDGTPPFYLAGLLHSDRFIQHAIQTTHGVNHPRTSWKAIHEFMTRIPPLPEQRKIAAVLFRIQKAIELQEAVIERTRELKKAAMQFVFTHGLRGEKTKETEIGRMPESWEVRPLNSLITKTDTVNLARDASRHIKYIDVTSVSSEQLTIISTSEYLLKHAPGRARKLVKNGDVIFATIRPSLKRIAWINANLDNQVCSTAFCVLRDNNVKTKGHFIFYVVQRREFIEKLAKLEAGASYPAVTDRQIKEQLIPVPREEEQKEIIHILGAIDSKFNLHSAKKSALQDLFKTTLNKLMSGEIRVKDLEIDVADNDKA